MEVERTPFAAAAAHFSFLEGMGFKKGNPGWPDAYFSRERFIIRYKGPKVAVTISYGDWEFQVEFTKDNVTVPYLFIDKNIFGGKSGYQGTMFPLDKLEEVATKIAADLISNYGPILNGEEGVWERLVKHFNAPAQKRRLPG